MLQLLFAYLVSGLLPSATKRKALAALIALLAAAALDGTTAEGWEMEYAFGHPFFFYLFMNSPIVLVVFALILLFTKKETIPDDPFK